MKFIQQDDIFDSKFNNRNQRYYFNNRIVKAKNRTEAVNKFKENYNIDVEKEKLTTDKNQIITL